MERGGFRQHADGPRLNGEAEANADKIENYYSQLENKWEALATPARNIPGFEQFLLPVPVEKLMISAKNGPVVLLNGTERGCNALILKPHRHIVQHVALPDVTMAKVRAIIKHLGTLAGSAVRDCESSDNHASRRVLSNRFDFPKILAQIWNGVVKPILQTLNMKVTYFPTLIFENSLNFNVTISQ